MPSCQKIGTNSFVDARRTTHQTVKLPLSGEKAGGYVMRYEQSALIRQEEPALMLSLVKKKFRFIKQL